MSRTISIPFLSTLVLLLACGRAERPDVEGLPNGAPNGVVAADLDMPTWMTVDHTARTVSMTLVAGEDNSNNYWNFNGYAHGEATITVPQGYGITINLRNADPATAHSVGVDTRQGEFPAVFEDPTPVFQGALTGNPTDPAGATQPNQSEQISFTADRAGDFALVCYVPAHAAAGMWVRFRVAPDQSAGLQTQ